MSSVGPLYSKRSNAPNDCNCSIACCVQISWVTNRITNTSFPGDQSIHCCASIAGARLEMNATPWKKVSIKLDKVNCAISSLYRWEVFRVSYSWCAFRKYGIHWVFEVFFICICISFCICLCLSFCMPLSLYLSFCTSSWSLSSLDDKALKI